MNSTKSIDDVLKLVYEYVTNQDSIELIKKAYQFADIHHANQFRKSGEPYIYHIIEVAYILASLQTSPVTIAAGILHDIIEDCDVSFNELATQFSPEIATLVEAVTKVGRLSHISEEEFQAENHRKIFIAMAKDVRVIIIKLADRLHNMRTLDAQPVEKQKRISKETLEVYSPIAHRLGINTIKSELEDLALFYLDRPKYELINILLSKKENERETSINNMINKIETLLHSFNLSFTLSGRAKSIYSIYKKMYVKNRHFEEIYDLQAIRIITETEVQCYEILGHIHNAFRPIPGRFKDYIAMPKPNMYQSLHTTIIADDGNVFEVQIRTKYMDEIAENGIAAHWRYKEKLDYDVINEQKEIEEKLHWFRDLVSITNSNSEDAIEYMESLQKDIFEANVYVFTPKGRVIDLPNGSTPIDFAYKIHTQVGDSAIGATVNGNLVPLNTVLKTGDVVDIRTSKSNIFPSEGWLDFVKTNSAKNHIRKALIRKNTEVNKDDLIANGKNALIEALNEDKIDAKEFIKKISDEKFLQGYNYRSIEDLYLAISNRNVSIQQLIEKVSSPKKGSLFSQISDFTTKKTISNVQVNSKTGIVVKGLDNVSISVAQCCSPIPGDEIVGYISKGLGVKIHRKDCPNIKDENKRLIEVEWDANPPILNLHPIDLLIKASDRPNLLVDIMNVLAQNKVTVKSVSASTNQNNLTAYINLNILVTDIKHLSDIIKFIDNVTGVFDVTRTTKN
jgi:GTP pyrophosphokinase